MSKPEKSLILNDREIKRIIFLVQWPLTSVEEDRWEFDFLRREGFEVEVFDLTPLLNRKELELNPPLETLGHSFIRVFHNYSDLDEQVGYRARDSIFFDYILGVSNINLKTARLFRILAKHNARYTFISAASLPIPIPSGALAVQSVLKKTFRKLLRPSELVTYFATRATIKMVKRRILFPVPWIIFGGNSTVLRQYVARRNMSIEDIIPVNSYDYDSYIKEQKGNPAVDRICVFLDDAATHHPDFSLLGIEPIDPEPYFRSMNKLFDRIEEKTGYRVVIAAHPRSNYESIPDSFGKRPIVKGGSAALTARSSLVIAHASTSIAFAVAGKKPILFVKTTGIKSNVHFNGIVDTMSGAVGMPALDVDSDYTTDLLYGAVNEEEYENYLDLYLRTPGAGDLRVWEIVVRTLRGL